MGARSLRLAAQDVALSRRKQGFESPRERQFLPIHVCNKGSLRMVGWHDRFMPAD